MVKQSVLLRKGWKLLLSVLMTLRTPAASRNRGSVVARMLALHKRLADARAPMAKELLQRQIDGLGY